MLVLIPAFCAVAGVLLYGFASEKAAELGRIMFGCAFLVVMLRLASTATRLF